MNVTHCSLYLIPKTLSSMNPPKKQRTTLGQEYQAYSCMNLAVFRFRSWYGQGGGALDPCQSLMSVLVLFFIQAEV